MKPASKTLTIAGIAAAASLVATASAMGASSASEVVPGRVGIRIQAVAALSAASSESPSCLTPLIQSMRAERRSNAALRRSMAVLSNEIALPLERVVVDGDGNTVRFTTERNAYDHVEAADDQGRPDAVDEALSGISRASRLLLGQMDLPSPGGVDVVLGRLGANVEGGSIPSAGRQSRVRVWIDPSARGAGAVRRAAEHQYAHAVATAAGLDPTWGEAFANWAALTLEGAPDDRTLASIAGRLAGMRAGLAAEDLEFGGGNAAWFVFLNESYGPTEVKLAVEELGRGGSVQTALDRAVRRATGDTIDAALRDFHLWSILVGPRSDGKHFSFAARLPGPSFAASIEALPALSVQSEPELGPMGQAAILLRPGERNGGLTLRFEGDLAARWAADVLLLGDDGERHRVAVPLDADDAGELSLPLQDVREVVLLVRNLDADGRPARRYSWSAYYEPRFPVEFGPVHADPTGPDGGALISWETASESGLLGFNVWRVRSDRTDALRVNPVWVPSLGDSNTPASYSFFDATAGPGVAYRYRVEAVTHEGLASRSESVAISPTP